MTGLASSLSAASDASWRASSRAARVDVELEVLALPDVLHRAVAERVQRFGDGRALRIEDRRLEGHEHTRTHQTVTS